jgi:hypothetical protein
VTLRCKPGDLAVIVDNDHGQVGHYVHVREQYTGVLLRDPGVWWVCAAHGAIRTVYGFKPAGSLVVIHDSALRPIRDPGEDAQDETLDWLPVPQQERSTA